MPIRGWHFIARLADQTRTDQTGAGQAKTRTDQTRRNKTRPNATKPDKTRQDRTRPDKPRQDQTNPRTALRCHNGHVVESLEQYPSIWCQLWPQRPRAIWLQAHSIRSRATWPCSHTSQRTKPARKMSAVRAQPAWPCQGGGEAVNYCWPAPSRAKTHYCSGATRPRACRCEPRLLPCLTCWRAGLARFMSRIYEVFTRCSRPGWQHDTLAITYRASENAAAPPPRHRMPRRRRSQRQGPRRKRPKERCRRP